VRDEHADGDHRQDDDQQKEQSEATPEAHVKCGYSCRCDAGLSRFPNGRVPSSEVGVGL
jgi:hypothetical protein